MGHTADLLKYYYKMKVSVRGIDILGFYANKKNNIHLVENLVFRFLNISIYKTTSIPSFSAN